MNWVDKLIKEYEEGRKALRKMHSDLDDSEENKIDKTQINSMIDEMGMVLEWLEIGREPGVHRGNDKRSIYQKRVLLDMELFPSLDILPEVEEERVLTEEERQAIAEVLAELSFRERQCYLLYYANDRTISQIAVELNISKSTAQSYLERAREKVAQKVSCRTIDI